MTCRILIVDDSPSFRKGMQALLEIQPDLQVAGTAPDGNQALELTERLRPDLVILDAQMPGMTGVEVAREMKSRWPDIKVILMTMYPDYRSKAIEAGADAFLTKGVPPEDILSVIREIREDGCARQESLLRHRGKTASAASPVMPEPEQPENGGSTLTSKGREAASRRESARSLR